MFRRWRARSRPSSSRPARCRWWSRPPAPRTCGSYSQEPHPALERRQRRPLRVRVQPARRARSGRCTASTSRRTGDDAASGTCATRRLGLRHRRLHRTTHTTVALRCGQPAPCGGLRADAHERQSMDEHVETVIIGAGQAGLSTGYHLARRGRSFVILEAAHAGRRQSGATPVRLAAAVQPGMVRRPAGSAVPGGPLDVPDKDEMADYLEAYARALRAAGAHRRRGRQLSARRRAATSSARRRRTGSSPTTSWSPPGPSSAPIVPDFAGELDPRIRQLHSGDVPRPVATAGRAGPGGRRQPLGRRHRLRGGAEPPDRPVRAASTASCRSASRAEPRTSILARSWSSPRATC